MLNQPKFKRHFHIEPVDPEGIFLLAENQYFRLSGQLYQQLVPLINGQHTSDDLVDLMQEHASAAEVYYALMLMEQQGYLIESKEQLPPNLAAFCDTLNVEAQQATHRLQTTKIAVNTIGNIDVKPFILLLESLSIQVQTEGDLQVVLTDDYLQNRLEEFNQNAWQTQRPWMLVKPVGTHLWIGPIFQPGKTGCWQCLAHRLRANRPVETFIQKRKNITTPFPTSTSILPSSVHTGLNIAATELIKWILQGENKQLEGTLVTFDTLTLSTRNHILTQRPQCPGCGTPLQSSRSPIPLILESRKKTFTTDGGHRYLSPEETLNQYEHHLSPITGIVRELRPVLPTTNSLIHTYVAGHNFATIFDDLYFLRQNLRGRSGGKGKTDIQAKASGFCEAIERYSGIFQGDEIRRPGTYQTLREVAIHPNAGMNFSEQQYQQRQEWNANCLNYFNRVPEPFNEDREIEWTPIWSLTQKQFKYLPTAYCYYGYSNSSPADCWADSNGTAAGNTKEEAILQGIMELVERDSVALWWYNRVKRPEVNLDSFEEPYFQALKDYYQTLDREIWVLDITGDLNIPTFAAISRRTDREAEDIVFAFGAHFDSKIAILRALTEINQILPAVLSRAADGNTQYPTDSESFAKHWWQTATIENQPYLVPDTGQTPKVYSNYPQLWSEDLREDVITCVKIAEKQGLEVLVLDQTRSDIGLNVVKVIIPGMRHFWKRLGPGRLYEVPVQLGWLSTPLKENQLNPIPIFI